MSNNFGVISTIVGVMERVEDIIDLSGIESKEESLVLIKALLGDEKYNQHLDIISDLIDFLCYLTKNKKKLHLNEKKCMKYLSSCCI